MKKSDRFKRSKKLYNCGLLDEGTVIITNYSDYDTTPTPVKYFVCGQFRGRRHQDVCRYRIYYCFKIIVILLSYF